MAKILVADDEQLILRLISDFLKRNGHEVIEAGNGDDAYSLFMSEKGIELAALDIMMPGLDGWEVCRRIREVSSIPVVLISARSQDFDQLTGFDAGADEYITKPFSPAVLVKRIEVLLKRSADAQQPHTPDVFELDGLTVRTTAHEVLLDGNAVELTLKEYKILVKLVSSAGRVYTRDRLLDDVWGVDFYGDIRTVDSHVARLRTKLGRWGANIKTIYGIGYKIEVGQ